MSLSLYAIADEYKYLLDHLHDEELGVIDEAILSRLNALDKPLEEKCINTIRYMKGIEAEYKAIEAERKAMQAREKSLKAKVEWYEDYLLENMEKSQIFEISCPQFVAKLRKNPPSTDIYDKDLIPEKYHKIKIEYDIQGIKDDLKADINVPGARLVRTNSLSIK